MVEPVSFGEERGKFRWSLKRNRFCFFVARSGDCADAAEKAGFQRDYGNQLMQMEPIQKKVQEELRNLLRAQDENEDSVVARWARWANVDPGDFFRAGYEVKDLEDMDEDQRKCIKKIKVTDNQYGRNVDLEFHDAHKANNDLANLLGMLHREDAGDTPEEAARSIVDILKEIADKDGLQEPPLESRPGQNPPRTH